MEIVFKLLVLAFEYWPVTFMIIGVVSFFGWLMFGWREKENPITPTNYQTQGYGKNAISLTKSNGTHFVSCGDGGEWVSGSAENNGMLHGQGHEPPTSQEREAARTKQIFSKA